MDNNFIKNKFLGAIMGASVGNALGTPLKNISKSEINEKYKKIDYYISHKDNNIKAGEYSADIEMLLLILQSLVYNGFIDIHDIIKRFLNWFYGKPKGIGVTTYNALYFLSEGYSYDEASQKAYTKMAATNGALIRNIPVILFNFKNPIETLIQDVIDISFITHYHPETIEGNIAFSLLLYFNLHNNNKMENFDSLFNADNYIKSDNIISILKDIPYISEKDLKSSKYINDTLKTALWLFYNKKDFTEGIIEAVNLGGDTPTITAAVGALFGSLYGINSIPQKYITGLLNNTSISELGEKLYKVVIEDKIFYEELKVNNEE